jgi:hypothetical protein
MEIKYRLDLYKLLPKNPVTCEIGVAEGNFSLDICTVWKPSRHYLVDNWSPIGVSGDGSFPQEWHNANHASAVAKMLPFKEVAVFLRGPSWHMAEHVADNTLDILYLDADHSYEGVKKDLEAWYPKVKDGGVIAGHDFINEAYGVRQAVEEFANRNAIKVNVIPENKDEDAGFWMYKPK